MYIYYQIDITNRMENDDFTNTVINRITTINDLRGKRLGEKIKILSHLLTLEGSERKWLVDRIGKTQVTDVFLKGVLT